MAGRGAGDRDAQAEHLIEILSGWSPKYFPPILVQYANSLIKDRVLFGSDYPAITPDRWMADFEKLAMKPEVRPMILKDNAIRLLGLRGRFLGSQKYAAVDFGNWTAKSPGVGASTICQADSRYCPNRVA